MYLLNIFFLQLTIKKGLVELCMQMRKLFSSFLPSFTTFVVCFIVILKSCEGLQSPLVYIHQLFKHSMSPFEVSSYFFLLILVSASEGKSSAFPCDVSRSVFVRQLETNMFYCYLQF